MAYKLFSFLQRTALATHDDRERRLRHTKAAARAAAVFDDGVDLENVVDVDNGEDQELAKLLKQQRQECKEDLPANRALRVGTCAANGGRNYPDL